MLYQVNPSVPVPAILANGVLVATLPAVFYNRKLTRLTINGPIGTRADVYRDLIADSSRLDSTARGQSNTAEYTNPIPVLQGSQILVVWSRSTPSFTGADTASAVFFLEGM